MAKELGNVTEETEVTFEISFEINQRSYKDGRCGSDPNKEFPFPSIDNIQFTRWKQVYQDYQQPISN